MDFYQSRLPKYARARNLTRILVILAGSGGAVLSYFRLTAYVIAITSFASAVVSWSEFSETGRKLERYSSAVRSLKKVVAWWQTLTDVERAGADNISMLVTMAEDIIADERQAWKSTASRLEMEARGRGEAAGELQKDDGKGRGATGKEEGMMPTMAPKGA